MCEVYCQICGESREPRKMIGHVANHLSEPMNLKNFVWLVHGVAPNVIAALADSTDALSEDQRDRLESDLLVSGRAAEIVKLALA
jgi:hypothetical protein